MQADILIVGGGIAGLWLLAECRAQGYQAYLVSDYLGAGQTIASQGIIHGGTKYALLGDLSDATLAIGDMPRIWRDALQGQGNIDLRDVPVLAENQLLWTSAGLGSRMTGFFASKAMKSRMKSLHKSDYPELFQTSEFKGKLYQLDEPVLDVPALLNTLYQQYKDYLIAIDPSQSGLREQGEHYVYEAITPQGEHFVVDAKQIVLTAGAGNEALMDDLTHKPPMQHRPLQMVLVKGNLPKVYAHALGVSDKPRVTITSHTTSKGDVVWYIGGLAAEQGVGKPPEVLIHYTQQELMALLPWLDQEQLQWGTWEVSRAEGLQKGGLRPDQPVVEQVANVAIAWPTKLAFAPMLAQKVMNTVLSFSASEPVPNLKNYPAPEIATPVWERSTFIGG